jgi:Membrane bound beta barrel domain (DUF5777)
VKRHSFATATALFLGVFLSSATFVHAQPPDTTPTATPAGAQPDTPPPSDDDARLRPIEPDYSLVNLPTTLPLPEHAGNFHLTHRFNENLRADSFSTIASNFFGLDEGATIDLEYRFGVMKHLEAIVARTNVDRTISMGAKFDPFHQSASTPFGLSIIASVEGGDNFSERFEPAFGGVVSHAFGERLAAYAIPMFVHNTQPDSGTTSNTFYIGLGARLKIIPTVFVVGEVTPRVSGYAPDDAEFAFSLEKRVGAHVFAVTFANSQATTYGQLARGALPQSMYLGFNLSRKFF